MDPVSPIEQTQAPIQAPNKKYVLLAFGVIAVIVLFAIITVITMTTAKKQVSSQISTKPNQGKSDNPKQNSFPSISPVVVDDWKIYQNAQFSINYPKDWQIEELIFTGGARGLGIKPTLFLTNSEKPNITISVNDVVFINNLLKSESMYSKLGFKRESIKINNLIETKFSGSIPKKTASVSATTKFLQTGYVILEQGGSSYVFDYSYVNPELDTQLEAIFVKIMSSFKAI